jgi:CubicO group peptidase (beta-lactamase class C family)
MGLDQALAFGTTVEAVREHYGLPGVAVAVVGPDNVLRIEVRGVSASDSERRLTSDDRFDLNSISKSFTGVLAAQLINEGNLSLQSPLRALLAESGKNTLDVHEGYVDVTLEDVLRHRAGLSRNGEHIEANRRPSLSGSTRSQRLQFARWLLANEPHSRLGEFHYSNAGFVLLAAIIQEIADSAWEAELEDRVLLPLGLSSAGTGWPGNLQSDFAMGHSRVHETGYAPRGPSDAWYPLEISYPAGGINMSINDLALYVQFHLRGLAGRSEDLPRSVFVTIHDTSEGYGFGWFPSEFESYPGSVHDGSDDGYYSKVFIVDDGSLGVAILTNIDDENAWKACNILSLLALQEFLVE